MRHLPVVTLQSMAACALACAMACTSTPGRTARLRFAYRAESETNAPLGDFVTSTGYHVVLTEARIALGPVYALRGPDARRHTTTRRMFADLLGPSRARAHGGVDPLSGRAILAQSLGQRAFDALDPAVIETEHVLATADVAGTVTVVLDPPTPENADALHAHHAYVEGTATKDGVVLAFAGGVDLPDSGTTRRVENVPLDAALDEGGTITLHVRPARWLDACLFSTLGPPGDDGVHPIAAGGQVAGAFRIGVRAHSAYAATYTEASP